MPLVLDLAATFCSKFSKAKGSPTAKVTPNERDLNVTSGLQISIPKEGRETTKTSLMSLPLEIRLQIYELLLLSRCDPDNPFHKFNSFAVGKDMLNIVHVTHVKHYLIAPDRTITPAILRTCQQSYIEANAILYSRNVFSFSNAETMLRFTAQIGSDNLKLIKTLKIRVPWNSMVAPWLQILHLFAEKAHGLQHIELTWEAETAEEGTYPWWSDPGTAERGLGESVEFIRAFGKIKTLKAIVLGGFYAKNWLAYVEKNTGGQVRTTSGTWCRETLEREGNKSTEELDDEEYEFERTGQDIRAFRAYQRGTDHLFP